MNSNIYCSNFMNQDKILNLAVSNMFTREDIGIFIMNLHLYKNSDLNDRLRIIATTYEKLYSRNPNIQRIDVSEQYKKLLRKYKLGTLRNDMPPEWLPYLYPSYYPLPPQNQEDQQTQLNQPFQQQNFQTNQQPQSMQQFQNQPNQTQNCQQQSQENQTLQQNQQENNSNQINDSQNNQQNKAIEKVQNDTQNSIQQNQYFYPQQQFQSSQQLQNNQSQTNNAMQPIQNSQNQTNNSMQPIQSNQNQTNNAMQPIQNSQNQTNNAMQPIQSNQNQTNNSMQPIQSNQNQTSNAMQPIQQSQHSEFKQKQNEEENQNSQELQLKEKEIQNGNSEDNSHELNHDEENNDVQENQKIGAAQQQQQQQKEEENNSHEKEQQKEGQDSQPNGQIQNQIHQMPYKLLWSYQPVNQQQPQAFKQVVQQYQQPQSIYSQPNQMMPQQVQSMQNQPASDASQQNQQPTQQPQIGQSFQFNQLQQFQMMQPNQQQTPYPYQMMQRPQFVYPQQQFQQSQSSEHQGEQASETTQQQPPQTAPNTQAFQQPQMTQAQQFQSFQPQSQFQMMQPQPYQTYQSQPFQAMRPFQYQSSMMYQQQQQVMNPYQYAQMPVNYYGQGMHQQQPNYTGFNQNNQMPSNQNNETNIGDSDSSDFEANNKKTNETSSSSLICSSPQFQEKYHPDNQKMSNSTSSTSTNNEKVLCKEIKKYFKTLHNSPNDDNNNDQIEINEDRFNYQKEIEMKLLQIIKLFDMKLNKYSIRFIDKNVEIVTPKIKKFSKMKITRKCNTNILYNPNSKEYFDQQIDDQSLKSDMNISLYLKTTEIRHFNLNEKLTTFFLGEFQDDSCCSYKIENVEASAVVSYKLTMNNTDIDKKDEFLICQPAYVYFRQEEKKHILNFFGIEVDTQFIFPVKAMIFHRESGVNKLYIRGDIRVIEFVINGLDEYVQNSVKNSTNHPVFWNKKFDPEGEIKKQMISIVETSTYFYEDFEYKKAVIAVWGDELVLGINNNLVFWKIEGKKESNHQSKIEIENIQMITSLHVIENKNLNSYLAVASEIYPVISILNKEHQIISKLISHTLGVTSLSSFGFHLFSGSIDSTVNVWNLGKSLPMSLFHIAYNEITTIETGIYCDQLFLFTGTKNHTVFGWNVTLKKILFEINLNENTIPKKIVFMSGSNKDIGDFCKLMVISEFEEPTIQNIFKVNHVQFFEFC